MNFGASLFFATVFGAARAVSAAEIGPAGETPPAREAAPLQAIHAHLCGLHFYSGDLKRQVMTHHYCAHVSDEVWQCVLYDSDKAGARLIGIEYVVSAAVFRTLPEEEKKLWHSHVYEVKSGMLIAPRLPAAAEKALMTELIGTYGKTWHTWQVDRGDRVPLGLPQLMMGLTADGQAQRELVDARDRELGISLEQKKKARADIVAPAILPGADAWQTGGAIQLRAASAPRPVPPGR